MGLFEKADCCYQRYEEILSQIKSAKKERGGVKYTDYRDALHADEFIVLRHDIEFSVDRAFRLAEVEQKHGIMSSYFVQITNNAYNAFSQKNLRLLQEISRMGHHIGLHYHRGTVTETDEVKKDIKIQAEMLSRMLDLPIDRFSFHRPLREHLAADLEVEGLINVYGKAFFALTDDPSRPLPVKYIADSNHQWKYGVPGEDAFQSYPKIQLLVHPLSWSLNGAGHVENFQDMVHEKHDEFVKTIEGEWKIFYELRGKL